MHLINSVLLIPRVLLWHGVFHLLHRIPSQWIFKGINRCTKLVLCKDHKNVIILRVCTYMYFLIFWKYPHSARSVLNFWNKFCEMRNKRFYALALLFYCYRHIIIFFFRKRETHPFFFIKWLQTYVYSIDVRVDSPRDSFASFSKQAQANIKQNAWFRTFKDR